MFEKDPLISNEAPSALENMLRSLEIRTDSYLGTISGVFAGIGVSDFKKLIGENFNLNPDELSEDVLFGMCQFLNNLAGFNKPLIEYKNNIPVLSFIASFTEDQKQDKDLIQLFFLDTKAVRSVAILKDDPEALKSLFFTQIYGNYIGETFDVPFGTEVLENFGSIVDSEQKILDMIDASVYKDDMELRKKIQKTLEDIRRVAGQSLKNTLDDIFYLADNDPEGYIFEFGAVRANAMKLNTDALIFTKILRTMGLDVFKHNPLEIIKGPQLSGLQKQKMMQLMQSNYEATYPGEQNTLFRQTVVESLKSAFNRDTTDFYLLKDEEQIVSFNRFDTNIDVEDGRVVMYFGSFNADSRYRGVGSVMLEHTIQEKLTECDSMQAHCDPASDISKKYIEDGFIAIDTEVVAGKFSFEIWRSQDSDQLLITKVMNITDLITVAGKQPQPDDHFFVRTVKLDDTFHELDEGLGYALTRYFTVKGVTYATFEIPPASLYKRFTPVREKEDQKKAA